MKGKKIAGLALASLLFLSGCSSTVQEDGKDVIASIDGFNILADDVYTTLSSTASGETLLFSYILDELIKANFPVTSDMQENASEIVSNIEANYQSSYGDDAETYLESALASAGYTDMDAYKESLLYSLQYAEFLKQYVKDNYDEVFEDYYTMESPRYISLIKVEMSDVDNPTTEESEKLEEVQSLLQTDKSFADIASDYSDDSTSSAKGNLGIVDSTSDLSSTYCSDVEEQAFALKEGEVSEAIKGDDGYYFLYCSSTNKDDIKNELQTIDIDSPLLVYDDYLVYLVFNSYDLTYGSEEIENQIQTLVDEALAERAELRGE